MINFAQWVGYLSAERKNSKGESVGTRLSEYEGFTHELPLPFISVGHYLIQAFEDLGRCTVIGMSLAPVGWTEIQSYSEATGELTEPWEKRLVRAMSLEFVKWTKRGQDIFAKEPEEL